MRSAQGPQCVVTDIYGPGRTAAGIGKACAALKEGELHALGVCVMSDMSELGKLRNLKIAIWQQRFKGQGPHRLPLRVPALGAGVV